ncbi:hypothetical protein OSB04_015853 [Centaurea solstitialis]|uniref:Zinc-finger domain-containing protein n=1 Tax=Centaurea solstitialis TaxID=347529 RepID=A0AA38T7L4_9ASTR|nr:hypothetical protein OSB04_015853 [Centaurea solstitialis]
MVSKKKRRSENGGNGSEKENDEEEEARVAEYEQSREQRIKENLQRMHKLGILELSRNLKPPPKPKIVRPQKRSSPVVAGSPRRSSRLKSMPSVSYSEKRAPSSKDKPLKDVKIEIKDGSRPEVYTEEHEKMLGDHKETWTLMVDGYDVEGNRIYDTYEGKSCHQCRQKTLGLRTKCCKCSFLQGQFCGDCLFMRYGENILEVNANPDWVCPACRDICNCSRCRRTKGWEPTGNIYRKTLRLGFKSVAHYLIHTRGPNGKHEDLAGETPSSSEDLRSPRDKEDEVSDDKNNCNMDEDGNDVLTEKNIKHHDPIGDQKPKGGVDLDDDDDPDYKSDTLDDVDNDDEDDSGDDDNDEDDSGNDDNDDDD